MNQAQERNVDRNSEHHALDFMRAEAVTTKRTKHTKEFNRVVHRFRRFHRLFATKEHKHKERKE